MKNINLKLLLAFTLIIVHCTLDITLAQDNVFVTGGRTKVMQWKSAGDYSAYDSLLFVVVDADDERIIQKTLTKTYATGYTTMLCTLYVSDTEDLAFDASYDYDIAAYGADTITVRRGLFNIIDPVQTSFNGTNLPEGVRVTTVSLANATTLYSTVVWDTTGKYYYPVSPSAFKGLYNLLGVVDSNIYATPYDLSLVEAGIPTFPDSLVYASELIPYVDKLSAQTITGKKTFTSNITAPLFLRGENDRKNVFVAMGDSRTNGYGGGGYMWFFDNLSEEFSVYDEALGGTEAYYMDSASVIEVDKHYSAWSKFNIMCLWTGANDYGNGYTTIETFNNIVAICSRRKAEGWKVLICTEVSLPGSADIQRIDLNNLIRRDYLGFADGLVDLGADTALGDLGDYADMTYHYDSVHLNETGYRRVSDMVETAINDLVAANYRPMGLSVVGKIYGNDGMTVAGAISSGTAGSNGNGVYMQYYSTYGVFESVDYSLGAYQNTILNPNGGKIGIRTTSPDSTLTVSGSGHFNSNLNIDGVGRFGGNIHGYDGLTIAGSINSGTSGSSGNGVYMQYRSTYGVLESADYTLGAYQNTILNPDGGKIGIGITSPDSLLTVDGGVNVKGGLKINNYGFPYSDGVGGYVLKTDGSGNLSFSPDISTSGAGLFNPDGVTIDTTLAGLARISLAWQDSVHAKMNRAEMTSYSTTSHTHAISGVTNLQDSLTAKANTAWFAISPTLIDDSIAVKMNRSEMTSYSTTSHTHIDFFDTLSYSINIPDTVTTGTIALWKMPNDITITEIAACTDANTSTFNIEERGETTPNSAGTDAMGSDLVADTNQEETSTFTNATISKNNWLALTVSVTGDVALLSITIRYIKTD